MSIMRRSKRDKPEIQIRAFLADNVATLRDQVFVEHDTVTARNIALAKGAETTLSQVQRILNSELGTSVDLIAKLARALKARPQDLLTPYFAVTPKQRRTQPHHEGEGDASFHRVAGRSTTHTR